MGLDIRWPIGLMFSLLGLLLAGFGIVKKSESLSMGINVNLIWGAVLLVFGVLMLYGAWRGSKTGSK